IRSARKRMLASNRAEVGSTLVAMRLGNNEVEASGISLRSAMDKDNERGTVYGITLPPRRAMLVSAAQLSHDCANELFGVAKEHQRVVEVVERVVDAGETGAHAAFDDHNGVGFIHVKDGHAEDGAGLIVAGGRIGDVVGADDEGNIGLRKVAVDLVHFDEAVVGDVGFGEQDIHVAGHASGDRMDGEANVDALLGEDVVDRKSTSEFS